MKKKLIVVLCLITLFACIITIRIVIFYNGLNEELLETHRQQIGSRYQISDDGDLIINIEDRNQISIKEATSNLQEFLKAQAENNNLPRHIIGVKWEKPEYEKIQNPDFLSLVKKLDYHQKSEIEDKDYYFEMINRLPIEEREIFAATSEFTFELLKVLSNPEADTVFISFEINN